jgi:hypothetical protein
MHDFDFEEQTAENVEVYPFQKTLQLPTSELSLGLFRSFLDQAMGDEWEVKVGLGKTEEHYVVKYREKVKVKLSLCLIN